MIIGLEEHKRLNQVLAVLKKDRLPFWNLWRDLADYFLPKRYVWLESTNESRLRRTARNTMIIDSTGTKAARILASGMFNGVTSPSRPWFSLRIPGFDDEGGPVTQWLEACTLMMMQVMAESNFYNALAVMYLDLVVFGTAAALIYEDEDTVVRCYNPALGEYYLGQSHRLSVDTFAREFCQSVKQLATQFKEENLTDQSKANYRQGGARALTEVKVYHLIEPNNDGQGNVPLKFKYRETYWEASSTNGVVLTQRGFNELPGIFPRWELTANDAYGTSPAMDALGDVIQLQQESKRKAQGLDKMINPPIVADIQLQHRPTALLPNGITYVAGQNNVGAKPLYQIAAPINEISQDIRDIQIRIQETFHNPLFNMISQLDTVRSATEIDARREEKLVLLGSVLERFENEALDPAIDRIFSIMLRKGMFPDPPEEIAGEKIEVQYVSILATIQRSLKAAPTERWVGLIGNLAGVVPQVLAIPDWDELIRNYGLDIGVPAKNMKTRDRVQEEQEAQAQQQQMAQEAEVANNLAGGAKTLSETEVGGGANALQQLLAQG